MQQRSYHSAGAGATGGVCRRLRGVQHLNGKLADGYKLPTATSKETELIGALILAPDRFAAVAHKLDLLDFSDELNALVVRAMLECHLAGLVPSPMRIVDRLDREEFNCQHANPVVFVWETARRGDHYPANIDWLADEVAKVGYQRRLRLGLHQARIDLDHGDEPADVLRHLQEDFSPRVEALSFASCADLPDKLIELEPPIVDGILRAGETMNIIGLTKGGKSWLAIYLNLCLATGSKLFDKFPCSRGTSLYANCELRKKTFERRVQDVAAAIGMRLRDVGKHFEWLNLRGQSMDLPRLLNALRVYPPGRFTLVTIDTLSRMIPKGMNENENADMTALYNELDAFGDRHGNASVLVHHPTKGSQTGKQTSDVGSGAGAIARCADVHLIFRPHEEEGAVVVAAVTRSFEPIQPFCLRCTFPIWRLAPDLDPARLKPERPPRQRSTEKPSAPIEEWTVERFASQFVTDQPRPTKADSGRRPAVYRFEPVRRKLACARS